MITVNGSPTDGSGSNGAPGSGCGHWPPRGVNAAAWLADRFRERREWESAELIRHARADGVSRTALYSPEVAALPIKKRQGSPAGGGHRRWFWWAEEGWPGPGPAGPACPAADVPATGVPAPGACPRCAARGRGVRGADHYRNQLARLATALTGGIFTLPPAKALRACLHQLELLGRRLDTAGPEELAAFGMAWREVFGRDAVRPGGKSVRGRP